MDTYGCEPDFRSKICSFVLPGIWVPQSKHYTQVQFLTGADCVISCSIELYCLNNIQEKNISGKGKTQSKQKEVEDIVELLLSVKSPSICLPPSAPSAFYRWSLCFGMLWANPLFSVCVHMCIFYARVPVALSLGIFSTLFPYFQGFVVEWQELEGTLKLVQIVPPTY